MSFEVIVGGGGGETLRSLVKTSFGRFEVAAQGAARRFVDRHRMVLHELP